MEITHAECTYIKDRLEQVSKGRVKNLSFMIPTTGIIFEISASVLSIHNGSFERIIKYSIFDKRLENLLLEVGDFILVDSNCDSIARYSVGIDNKFRPVFDAEKSRKAITISSTLGKCVLDAAWKERIPLEDITTCYKGVFNNFQEFIRVEFSTSSIPTQYWGLSKFDVEKEMLQDGYVYRDRVVFSKNFYPFA